MGFSCDAFSQLPDLGGRCRLPSARSLEEVVTTEVIPTAGVGLINAIPDSAGEQGLDFRFIDFVESNAQFRISFRNTADVGRRHRLDADRVQARACREARRFRIFLDDTLQAVASTVLKESTLNLVADHNDTVLLWAMRVFEWRRPHASRRDRRNGYRPGGAGCPLRRSIRRERRSTCASMPRNAADDGGDLGQRLTVQCFKLRECRAGQIRFNVQPRAAAGRCLPTSWRSSVRQSERRPRVASSESIASDSGDDGGGIGCHRDHLSALGRGQQGAAGDCRREFHVPTVGFMSRDASFEPGLRKAADRRLAGRSACLMVLHWAAGH